MIDLNACPATAVPGHALAELYSDMIRSLRGRQLRLVLEHELQRRIGEPFGVSLEDISVGTSIGAEPLPGATPVVGFSSPGQNVAGGGDLAGRPSNGSELVPVMIPSKKVGLCLRKGRAVVARERCKEIHSCSVIDQNVEQGLASKSRQRSLALQIRLPTNANYQLISHLSHGSLSGGSFDDLVLSVVQLSYP